MSQVGHDGIQSARSGSQTLDQTDHKYDEPNYPNHGAADGGSRMAASAKQRLSAKLANPLAGKSHAELEEMGARYAKQHQLGEEEDIRAFQKGACLAQDPQKYGQVAGLTGPELDVLEKEFSHRWSQPRLLYLVIVLCSTCAAVQGMG
jgi:hypothetical protein